MMILITSAVLSALVTGSMAQWGSNPSKTTGSAASSPSSSTGAVHTVTVGQGGSLSFSPSSLTASSGDQVEFHFASPGHSVAQGVFKDPCNPLGGKGFYSGFVSGSSEPFTVTINDTKPIYYYCSQVGHCQAGMVGAVNAPADQSEADYAAAAKKTSQSKSPLHVEGGVFAAASTSSSSSNSTPSKSSGASIYHAAEIGKLILGCVVVITMCTVIL